MDMKDYKNLIKLWKDEKSEEENINKMKKMYRLLNNNERFRIMQQALYLQDYADLVENQTENFEKNNEKFRKLEKDREFRIIALSICKDIYKNFEYCERKARDILSSNIDLIDDNRNDENKEKYKKIKLSKSYEINSKSFDTSEELMKCLKEIMNFKCHKDNTLDEILKHQISLVEFSHALAKMDVKGSGNNDLPGIKGNIGDIIDEEDYNKICSQARNFISEKAVKDTIKYEILNKYYKDELSKCLLTVLNKAGIKND